MGRRKPALVIVGGINGCGKTTFAKRAGPAVFLGQTAINPDDLTREVVSKFPSLQGDGANLVGVERAEKAAWHAIAEGSDVAIETVLSSAKFLPLVQAARFRKYRTRLIYVGLPTVELAIARVAQRVALGGHDVPEVKIRERWARTHNNLVLFALEIDELLIFSNGQLEPALVAERTGRAAKIKLYDPNALPEITLRLNPPPG